MKVMMMVSKYLIDKVAKAIYHVNNGLTDEDYVEVFGKNRRVWDNGLCWSKQQEGTLCEHERDEYRQMAKAAILVILGDSSNEDE